VNDAPIAQDVSATTEPDTPVTAFFDASDPDNGDTLTYTVVTSPSKGLVTNNNNGTFTFDPDGEFDPDEVEDVTFTYKARDNNSADSATKTVTNGLATMRPWLRMSASRPRKTRSPRVPLMPLMKMPAIT
jgi:hypothetical protein